jgi:CheY-like chemotaxis protein
VAALIGQVLTSEHQPNSQRKGNLMSALLVEPVLCETRDTPSLAPAAGEVGTILVVDDSPVDRRLAGAIVEKVTTCRAIYAQHGVEALDILKREKICVVLTDMQMPEMDGLELVEAVRADYPLVPVILMTAYGSEELAIQALQRGASNYVPKKNLSRELAQTFESVLTASRANLNQKQVLGSMTDIEVRFALENDPSLVPSLVATLQEQAGNLKLCDGTAKIRLGVALEESLLNGLYHGNLELSSDLRQDGGNRFQLLAMQRRTQAPYCERRLWLTAKLSRSQATFVMRDEGPGFDPSKLPDPTDPANMDRIGGRGLLLIRTFMDDVRFNDRGNEITLVKRAKGR